MGFGWGVQAVVWVTVLAGLAGTSWGQILVHRTGEALPSNLRTPLGLAARGGYFDPNRDWKGQKRHVNHRNGQSVDINKNFGDCTMGAADLTVPLFSPPLLITESGRPFFVNEETQNVGNVSSPPSVTRYYIASSEPIDPQTAQVVGERNVPALQPGERNRVSQQVLAIPSGLPPGTYLLAACADANQRVTELSEKNNCSFSELRGR